MARPDETDAALGVLAERLGDAVAAAGLPEAEPGLERPKQSDHGDWASTVPMRLAKQAGKPPREIAQAIIDNLDLPDSIDSVEIAGPGFLNFRLADSYYEGLLRAIAEAGSSYGRSTRRIDETVNVEFVSANPTGPLHIGHGRWAATGDAVAELIDASGRTVQREYYVNDSGEQIRRFGESLVLVHAGRPLDEDHYRGAYIHDIARDLVREHGEAVFDEGPDTDERVGELGVEAMRSHIQATLHGLGVDFDVWFSERVGLHESGAVEQTIQQLREAGHVAERDGALYLLTEALGDDKDRVIVRSDGRPTYFAADIAYLRDKWSRADRLVYLLGADHHGYVGRMKAAAICLGIPEDALEIRIGQLVNLLRDGEPVKMSKRSGELITLDEVVEEVGVDVARYQFLRQSLDTMVDFDLSVVTAQSMDNPVYYVQYAHARVNSLVRTADERGLDAGSIEDVRASVLQHEAERQLLAQMAQLPLVVAEAAELLATQRLARYAEELAGTFHRFYTECRVLVDDQELSRARYWLAFTARQVLANALGILRVQAPERM